MPVAKELLDDEILKSDTIDFTAFSYYFSQVSTTQQGCEKKSVIESLYPIEYNERQHKY